jgi:hypothetical protein
VADLNAQEDVQQGMQVAVVLSERVRRYLLQLFSVAPHLFPLPTAALLPRPARGQADAHPQPILAAPVAYGGGGIGGSGGSATNGVNR